MIRHKAARRAPPGRSGHRPHPPPQCFLLIPSSDRVHSLTCFSVLSGIKRYKAARKQSAFLANNLIKYIAFPPPPRLQKLLVNLQLALQVIIYNVQLPHCPSFKERGSPGALFLSSPLRTRRVSRAQGDATSISRHSRSPPEQCCLREGKAPKTETLIMV